MHRLGDVPRSHLHKPEAELFGSSLPCAHSAWRAESQFSEQMCAHAKIHLRDRTESYLDGAHLIELGGEVVKEW